VIPVAGGPARRLTETGEFPTWSIDGHWIYFVGARDGWNRVWKVAAAGGNPRLVEGISGDVSSVREGPDGQLYFSKTFATGIWRHHDDRTEEVPVVQDFPGSLPGFWTLSGDGIYYVARSSAPDAPFAHHIKFFDFGTRRTTELGVLPGRIDDWVGTLTVSADRRTVIYSQQTYASREIVLVDHYR
jgi:hypothetical protein